MMTSASASAPVRSTAPRPIKSRETLWEGGVAEVSVPAHAKSVVAENTPDGKITYLTYAHTLKGGKVHVHVRTLDPLAYKGKMVRARVIVKKKTYSDGASDMYIDLYPTDEMPTCSFTVVNTDEVPPRYAKGDTVSIKASDPKVGWIVITHR